MRGFDSMKDISCYLMDVADAADVEYDLLVTLVEFMVKVGHKSYEEALYRINEEFMIRGDKEACV